MIDDSQLESINCSNFWQNYDIERDLSKDSWQLEWNTAIKVTLDVSRKWNRTEWTFVDGKTYFASGLHHPEMPWNGGDADILKHFSLTEGTIEKEVSAENEEKVCETYVGNALWYMVKFEEHKPCEFHAAEFCEATDWTKECVPGTVW